MVCPKPLENSNTFGQMVWWGDDVKPPDIVTLKNVFYFSPPPPLVILAIYVEDGSAGIHTVAKLFGVEISYVPHVLFAMEHGVEIL